MNFFFHFSSATDTIFDVTVEIKKWNKPFISTENAKRAYREIKTLKVGFDDFSFKIFSCKLIMKILWECFCGGDVF